ncbi:MAG: aminomethyl-transferring glycine dehydrogenase [Bacteroidales bacterium]|nr:aminomethyl-transferring glycine dehydrogenase [Bacteroidales bacterium]
MNHNTFSTRHIGPQSEDIKAMLDKMGLDSIDQLINETIPEHIRLEKDLDIKDGVSEFQYLKQARELASKNKVFKTYIGLGYYNTFVPPVIMRNVFENPGWYTAYTPYQAEISQGRLEALLNYQTMVADLTGLPLANASLLDEGTAAAEAMLLFFNARPRALVKAGANVFLASEDLFPQTLEVLKTRAGSQNIELRIVADDELIPDENVFGCMVQYPNQKGQVNDYAELAARFKEKNIPIAAGTDLLSLTLLTPPGEWGADVVFGSSQRLGVPMGYGGPHAAFFATTENYKRQIPGRIIGISKDTNGNQALRMALQTREQHIKREKATSNICTAQALLAMMAGFYGVYHGKEGLTEIAADIHHKTARLADAVNQIGYKNLNSAFFDTLYIELPATVDTDNLRAEAEKHNINFRYIDAYHIGISLNETTEVDDLNEILQVLAEVSGNEVHKLSTDKKCFIPENLKRTSDFMSHPVFQNYRSETQMMRYLKKLENKDLALNRSMIPLGSCTMKLNAASEMMPVSWPEFTNIHPFVPADQAQGYLEMIKEMEQILCTITGFDGLSFMPNSGAAGEYAGLLVIKAYQDSLGQNQRNVCLIPASAHGTNPASAVMAGFEVAVVKTDAYGNVDVDDLKEKAEKFKDTLGAFMITYPSTHGVFEQNIRDIIEIIHQNGGQVYMDGANMNAQVGYTNPGFIGADVCHLNLHKTFGIPHGGGGPGVGPIGVAKHLKPFLPSHIFSPVETEEGISAVSSAPFGSALVLMISYGYLKMLGKAGLKESTAMAILNANYLKEELKDYYPILYTGKNGRVAHEMILDCNAFSRSAGVEVIDIAKRLMDFGFHAPTVAFPVHGTLMVEPTESEPLEALDRFVEAMKTIREEIREIEEGKAEQKNNVVSNAPHTAEMIITSDYQLPYSREKAAFPLEWIRESKYFTPVAKIDDAFGDRNLCTCLPIEAYDNPVMEFNQMD